MTGMIAVRDAKQAIHDQCPWVRYGSDHQVKWYDTRRAKGKGSESLEQSISILEERCLVLRHAKHPHLVRIVAFSGSPHNEG